jgi:cytochrome subunit of sulfide dehydrogenase
MIRSLRLCLLASAAGMLPGQVLPADSTARSLAANCTGCHGFNGASAGDIPSIAGMDQARMVALMREFRDGKREATVMHQHAKGYTDDQIEAIAAWFARQK